jgi:hypothetical protein
MSGCTAAHFTIQTVTEALTGLFQVVVSLQAHPESLGASEIARQAQGGIRRYRVFAMHDLVDTPRRNADITCQPILADLQKTAQAEEDLIDIWLYILFCLSCPVNSLSRRESRILAQIMFDINRCQAELLGPQPSRQKKGGVLPSLRCAMVTNLRIASLWAAYRTPVGAAAGLFY